MLYGQQQLWARWKRSHYDSDIIFCVCGKIKEKKNYIREKKFSFRRTEKKSIKIGSSMYLTEIIQSLYLWTIQPDIFFVAVVFSSSNIKSTKLGQIPKFSYILNFLGHFQNYVTKSIKLFCYSTQENCCA